MWQIPELDAQAAEALLELWPPGVSTHSWRPFLTLSGHRGSVRTPLVASDIHKQAKPKRLLIDSND